MRIRAAAQAAPARSAPKRLHERKLSFSFVKSPYKAKLGQNDFAFSGEFPKRQVLGEVLAELFFPGAIICQHGVELGCSRPTLLINHWFPVKREKQSLVEYTESGGTFRHVLELSIYAATKRS